MSLTNIFETRQKGLQKAGSSVHLFYEQTTPIVEIRYKSEVVAKYRCPATASGMSLAKRIYNGMQ